MKTITIFAYFIYLYWVILQQKRKLEPFEEEMLKFVKDGGDKKEDQFDIFGKMVASKLRRMHESDSRLESRCELKIHEIIYDSETEFL